MHNCIQRWGHWFSDHHHLQPPAVWLGQNWKPENFKNKLKSRLQALVARAYPLHYMTGDSHEQIVVSMHCKMYNCIDGGSLVFRSPSTPATTSSLTTSQKLKTITLHNNPKSRSSTRSYPLHHTTMFTQLYRAVGILFYKDHYQLQPWPASSQNWKPKTFKTETQVTQPASPAKHHNNIIILLSYTLHWMTGDSDERAIVSLYHNLYS